MFSYLKKFVLAVSLFAPAIAYASHIDATELYSLHTVANVTDFSGEWVNTSGTPNEFSHVSDLVFVPETGNDSVLFNTFVSNRTDYATLTMDFGGNIVGNLSGDDLAIFTLGHATLDITANGITNRYTSSTIQIDGLDQGVFAPDGTLLDTNDVILIDLDDFSLAPGIGINVLSLDTLDATVNPDYFPAITAAGGFNTEGVLPPTVIPLPLPVILFGSGLGLLGLLARKRR